MHYDDAALLRHTLAQPEHAGSLLRTILPRALANAVDWGSLRRVPGSSVDAELTSHHADLLFEARLAGGVLLIYVLLERPGDRWTPLHVLRYVLRVVDSWRLDHAHATGLPPVLPVVVHHGARAWRGPRTPFDLVDLAALPPAAQAILSPLQPGVHFLLDDLAAATTAQLCERGTTLAVRSTLLLLRFVRGARHHDPAEFVRRWLDLLRALWREPAGRRTAAALFGYMACQLESPCEQFASAASLVHEEARIMSDTIADQFREEGFRSGLAQGLQAGRAEGRAELMLRLLRRRFGSVTPAVEARIRAADIEQLEAWAERLLTAADPAQVLG
ncbi:MAG TPA: Rpn family recombination-promoting nuclease/putative transposase [Planctomycetota bacterium]|nr:Rpn family recombination-promoting nuclease/putative transposase [Planctomycetota bacterium]